MTLLVLAGCGPHTFPDAASLAEYVRDPEGPFVQTVERDEATFEFRFVPHVLRGENASDRSATFVITITPTSGEVAYGPELNGQLWLHRLTTEFTSYVTADWGGRPVAPSFAHMERTGGVSPAHSFIVSFVTPDGVDASHDDVHIRVREFGLRTGAVSAHFDGFPDVRLLAAN